MRTVKQLIDMYPNKKVWELINEDNYCSNVSSLDENDNLVWGFSGKAVKCNLLNWISEKYIPLGLYQEKLDRFIDIVGLDTLILAYGLPFDEVKEKLKLADI